MMKWRYVGKKTQTALLSGMAGVMMLWSASQTMAGDRPAVEECMRCHDVKTYQYEKKHSSHAFDTNNKEITCGQCHDFHFNPVTAYYAREKYFENKIFKPEDFDRKRMQQNVKKTVPAKKCQVCHEDLSKNVKGDPISEVGQLCHDAFEGKNGTTNRSCAGCHINMAHLPDFDRHLTVNTDFAMKLAENPMASDSKKEGEK